MAAHSGAGNPALGSNPFAVKLDSPSKFFGEMDQEVVESWVFQVENYFALSGILDENIKARYSTMLLQKSAAIWLRNQNYDYSTLKWTNLKQDIYTYFKPADSHRRARDALANCTQTSSVSKYIDAMKRHGQRVAGVTDDEMLDRFVRGLRKNVQREVLKDNPATFADACMLAERIGRLDDFLAETKPQRPHVQSQGWVPMEIDTAQAQASAGQYDRSNASRGARSITCYYCGKRGHMARDCFAKRAHAQGNSQQFQRSYVQRGRGRGRSNRQGRGFQLHAMNQAGTAREQAYGAVASNPGPSKN